VHPHTVRGNRGSSPSLAPAWLTVRRDKSGKSPSVIEVTFANGLVAMDRTRSISQTSDSWDREKTNVLTAAVRAPAPGPTSTSRSSYRK
jgi:hypothetical protein